MKQVLVGVAVALALVTSQAAADGIDSRHPPTIAAPVPVPIYAPTWTGFYIGAGIGGGAIVHDLSIRDDLGPLLDFDGIGGEGIFGTAIIGWDWQFGRNGVFGVFADYDFSDISTETSVFGGDMDTSIDHEDTWSVGARLGWLATPGTLIYATAGYTEAQLEHSISFDNVLGFDTFGRDRTFSGYFVGGGIDTRLGASNWFARLEYRFTDFDSERILRADFDDDFLRTRADLEPSMHTGRLTLTYKFTGAGLGGWNANGWGNGY